MPTYVFTNARTGEQVDRFIPVEQVRVSGIPRTIRRRGRTFVRDLAGEHRQGCVVAPPKCYPYWSDALGNLPSQNSETLTYLRARGVRAEMNGEGQMKVENRNHLKKLMRAFHLHERN